VPSKQSLGLVLTPMTSTADSPTRAGLLVIQVKDGSIAQGAGIAVGDIIRSFGDAQITQVMDLQTAIAATAPGSSVQIKIIRGATDMTITTKF
jgi:S1-C subfamily serine protease